MKLQHALAAVGFLTAATLIYTAALYPHLPDRIPIHWNVHGQVDGWGEKQWAAWFGPGMTLLLAVSLFALPYLSPREFSLESFQETFHYTVVVVAGMMSYFHGIMLQAALRPDLEAGRALVAGVFLVLALVGNVLGKVRRNFWFGVRTPWTLASERVWLASNRLAARLMAAGGLLGALAVWWGAPLAPCFTALLATLAIPILHSLVLYKRWEREGRLE